MCYSKIRKRLSKDSQKIPILGLLQSSYHRDLTRITFGNAFGPLSTCHHATIACQVPTTLARVLYAHRRGRRCSCMPRQMSVGHWQGFGKHHQSIIRPDGPLEWHRSHPERQRGLMLPVAACCCQLLPVNAADSRPLSIYLVKPGNSWQ